jgi:tripartite-type tricarboxylate transporter receptor subunit TctC
MALSAVARGVCGPPLRRNGAGNEQFRIVTLRARLHAAAIVMLCLASQSAVAQDFPNREVHFICAIAPGSGADIIVRYIAEKMRVLMQRPVIVENKPGASGNIATEYAARAKPDGYTVYVHAGSAIAANMHLFKRPPVDITTALQVVATINRQPFMLVVDAKRPWTTVADLTQYVRQKRGKTSYATVGPIGRVMGALYNKATGVNAVEVQYKTAMDSLNDMASGALDYAMQDPQFSLAQAREGRLRILAVSTGQRLKANPNLPTMQEAGVPGIDMMGWFAAMVPAATPRLIVDQLNGWFNQVVSQDDTRQFLNRFGGDPWITTPDEGQARLRQDVDAWADYVKIARIEPAG